MAHSPADVIAYLLVANEQAVWEDKDIDLPNWKWKVYVAIVPDAPIEVITVYDTQGLKDGRTHLGKTVHRPGIQLMSRSINQRRGFYALQKIADFFDSILAAEIVTIPAIAIAGQTIPASQYRVNPISQTSHILSAGQDDKKRFLNTLNCQAIISQIEE